MESYSSGGKHIGIIGGSGPEAGILLAQALVDAKKAFLGASYKTDKDAPHFTLYSVPPIGGPHLPEEFVPGSTARNELWCNLRSILRNIAPNVDFICIACNTLHIFESDIREFLLTLSESKGVSCEFVSIIDATLLEVKRRGYCSLRIFGSKVITNYNDGALDQSDGVISPYSRLNGIVKLVAIHAKEKDNMQKLISSIKQHGPHGALLQNSFKELIDASPVPCILACTEFDLLMNNLRTNSMLELVDSRKVLFPTFALAKLLIEKSSTPN